MQHMTETITSLRNPRVMQAAQLRDARQRRKQGRFLIDGMREIQRAVQGGIQLDELYVCPELARCEADRQWPHPLAGHAGAAFRISAPVMSKLAYGDRAESLLAVGLSRVRTLLELQLPPEPLIAVLCGIEKPGNLGAVLRSADGAGVHAVVVADAAADLFNPNTIRASLGTVFTQPVVQAAQDEALAWLREHSFRILAARVDATVPHHKADFRGRTAIVLGSEAAGLDERWQGADFTAIALAMRGQADSLNVSATAAVLFYEAARQRG